MENIPNCMYGSEFQVKRHQNHIETHVQPFQISSGYIMLASGGIVEYYRQIPKSCISCCWRGTRVEYYHIHQEIKYDCFTISNKKEICSTWSLILSFLCYQMYIPAVIYSKTKMNNPNNLNVQHCIGQAFYYRTFEWYRKRFRDSCIWYWPTWHLFHWAQELVQFATARVDLQLRLWGFHYCWKPENHRHCDWS